MNLTKIYEDFTGITRYKESLSIMSLQFLDLNIAYDSLQKLHERLYNEITSLQSQITEISKKLTDQKVITEDTKKQLILQIKVAEDAILQKYVLLQQVQSLKSDGATLFRKPLPALLTVTDPKYVLLGGFSMWTTNGIHRLDYPYHGAVFTPCPMLETILTKADCNRKRTDLTPVQICDAIANVYHNEIKYRYDQDQWNRPDNWTPALLVHLIGGDDCESSATAIISAIQYYEQKFGVFKDIQAMLGLGHINGLGHGFVLLLNPSSVELKDSYVIEPTLEFSSKAMPLSEACKNYDCDWGVIGFPSEVNPEGSYQFSKDRQWWLNYGVVGEPAPSFIRELKNILFPKKEMTKRDIIYNLWANRDR